MNGRTRSRVARCTVILATALAFPSCTPPAPEEVESEGVAPVTTAVAATGTIRGIVHATGVVAPAPGAELVVVAPEPARIEQIPRAEGERVRKNDVLVRFEIPGTAAEVERQAAEVRRARASVANAEANLTRARDLFMRGVAARKDVEDAERQLADGQAALEQAQASHAAAETVAARSTVRATFDGLVARRYHNPGDLVEPSASDPVLRVIDPDRLQIIASVPLGDVPRVRLGAAGHLVKSPSGTARIPLTVVSRPSVVDPGSATVPVRLRAGGLQGLASGTPVDVEIEAEQHTGVVLVPEPAIVRSAEETAVMIVEDGKAFRRRVEVGLSDGAQVEIVAGVNAGDHVVVLGQAGLPDGAEVREAGDTDR